MDAENRGFAVNQARHPSWSWNRNRGDPGSILSVQAELWALHFVAELGNTKIADMGPWGSIPSAVSFHTRNNLRFTPRSLQDAKVGIKGTQTALWITCSRRKGCV